MKIISLLLFTLLSLTSFTSHASTTVDFATSKDVHKFVNEMVKKHRFSKQHLNDLFNKATAYKSILEAIARPAESKPWYQYRPIFVTRDRTRQGINFWKKHAQTLSRASEKYGVPEEIIVAIIGVETRYGKHAGRYPVFDALATLAFGYPPRSSFFRKELEQFLLMTREEKIKPRTLLGSYAGAMGLPQFIPSSFRRYAIDFDGDGKRDLWKNPVDAIGSVANYFKKHHWKKGQPIVHQVQVHGEKHNQIITKTLKPEHSQQDLLNHGVILPGNLPGNLTGKLLKLKKSGKYEFWVGWKNFYVITRYNHSALYSMAVYQLSQEIKRGYRKL